MSEAEHTPGPWKIRKGSRHSPEECDLKIVGDIFCLAELAGPLYSHDEANAHLMAAAPDLLEVLTRIAEWAETADSVEAVNGLPQTAKIARTAIAKATGEGVGNAP